jgi:hypothetical protein
MGIHTGDAVGGEIFATAAALVEAADGDGSGALALNGGRNNPRRMPTAQENEDR